MIRCSAVRCGAGWWGRMGRVVGRAPSLHWYADEHAPAAVRTHSAGVRGRQPAGASAKSGAASGSPSFTCVIRYFVSFLLASSSNFPWHVLLVQNVLKLKFTFCQI